MDYAFDVLAVLGGFFNEIFFSTGLRTAVSVVGLSVGSLAAFLIYAIPTMVAITRSHHRITSIVVLNILLGWTFLGWVIALALSGSDVRHAG